MMSWTLEVWILLHLANRNPASEDAALQCITDLVDCCGTESGTVRTEHGDWYFPDGTRVGLFIISRYKTRFLVNRGPNEVINGQQFNGSVHLFRRFSSIPQRGCFRCELPSAANPSVNQTIYVNICELIILLLLGILMIGWVLYTVNFGSSFNVPHVTTSSSGSNTAGAVYSLTCSSTLNSDSIPLPNNVPAPTFVWFFGPNGNNITLFPLVWLIWELLVVTILPSLVLCRSLQ